MDGFKFDIGFRFLRGGFPLDLAVKYVIKGREISEENGAVYYVAHANNENGPVRKLTENDIEGLISGAI